MVIRIATHKPIETVNCNITTRCTMLSCFEKNLFILFIPIYLKSLKFILQYNPTEKSFLIISYAVTISRSGL